MNRRVAATVALVLVALLVSLTPGAGPWGSIQSASAASGIEGFSRGRCINFPPVGVILPFACPPVTNDDRYETPVDTVLNVPAPGVLTNDTPNSGRIISVGPSTGGETVIRLTGSTAHGGQVRLRVDGSFAYTPPSGFAGFDTFVYKVVSGGGSATATVTISVGAATISSDDSYSTLRNTALNVPAPGVLNNDTGLPAPTATPITNGSTTQSGTVTLNGDGSFAYTPPMDFTGDDSFTYTATNAFGSDTATVTISVQAPAVASDDNYNVLKNTVLNVPASGVLSNDTGFPVPAAMPISGDSTAQGGTVTLNADGSFAYTPPADFTGEDSFTYTATNVLASDTATVTIAVQAPAAANDDSYTTPKGSVLNVPASGVLANDTGFPIPAATPIASGATTQGGTVTLNADGSFAYTPKADFTGDDSFTYTASNTIGSDTATVTISVQAPAVASDDNYNVIKNSVLNISAPGVLSNDTGFPAPAATPIAGDSTAQGGTVTLNADGSFEYTPPTGFTGSDSFTYTATNALGSDTATVTITVQAPAAASDDSYTVLKDTVLTIAAPGVLSNDAGFPIPVATPITDGSTAQGGTVTLNADGGFSYTPAAGFTGDDSFTYTVANALGSDSATVTISVQTPPVAMDNSYTTLRNTPLGIPAPGVLANDSGFPALVATPISSGSTAQGGTITLSADGSFAYTPPTGFTGDDSFTYTASNAVGNDNATVTISVQAPAVANDDSYTTQMDTVQNISAPGVLSNDTGFPAPTAVPIANAATTQGGTVTLNADGSFDYSPPADFIGEDSFTYTASNAAGNDTAVVTISVQTPPVAIDDSYDVLKNTTLNVSAPGVLSNDTGFPVPTATPIANGSTTQGGTVTLNANGSFSFTPKTDFTGTDSFTYTATNVVGSDTATVTISVEAPAVANDDTYDAVQDTTLNIAAPGLLANDTGFPAPTVTPIANGSTAQGGTVTLNADGSFGYTPPTGFTGEDSFTYTATNALGNDTGTVTITVRAPAVANDDSYITLKDTPLGISAPGVLANDTGYPAPTATPIASGATTQGGTITLSADGSFAYTPPTGFTGDDSFTYTASNAAGSDNATVTITVRAPAVANDDSYTTPKDTPLGISAPGVLANDTGYPAPTATPISNSSTAEGGTVTLNANGGFSYTPKSGFTGDDSFTYTATNAAGSDTATVTISIESPPAAQNDTYPQTVIGNVSIDTALIPFSVTSNDTFTSPVTITAFDATSAHGGTVGVTTSGSGIGQFTYNPPAGYEGPDSFTYTITNASGSSTGTVNLTVSGMIWFINNGASSPGDGRLSSPFNTLALFNSVNNGTGNNPASGDHIFLYESATSYTGPVTLLNNQRIIGQDAKANLSTITGLTPPSGSAGFPAMNATNGTTVNITSTLNGINLAERNLIQGLTIGNATGIGINGSNFGTATIKDTSINNGTGSALSLVTGTLDATLTSVSAKNAANGILLSDTSGSFAVIGDGLTAGSGGTIQSITNRGASFTNASNISLRFMNFTNAGTTNGTGCTSLDAGVDANTNLSCNAAIHLVDVTNVTLDHMVIDGSEQAGINGNNVSGFTLSNSEVKNAGTKTQTSPGIVPESGLQFVNLLGNASITGSNIHDNAVNNLAVHNNSGTLTSLAISNTIFSMTGNGTQTNNAGAAGIDFSAQSTAVMTMSLKNSTVTKSARDGLNSSAIGSAKTNTVIEANAFTNNGQRAISITGQDSAAATFTVKDNTPITGQVGSAINIELLTNSNPSVAQNATLTGTITGNTIGTPGVPKSGSSGAEGIDINSRTTLDQTGTVTVAITDNSINGIENIGIFVSNGDGHSTMNVTATGNSIDMQSPIDSYSSLYAMSSKGSPSTSGLCLDFRANSTTNTAGVFGLRVGQRTTGYLRLPGYTGSGTDDTAVQNFLIGQNSLQGSDVFASHESAAGFSGGGACTMP